MSKLALTNSNDYEEIISYVVTGQSAELSEEKQRILERWRVGSALLRQHPQKMKAARLLKERFPDVSIRQAQIDIDNGCKLWCLTNKIDKTWLGGWLIERLLLAIVNAKDPHAEAKNLATLQRLYDNSPDVIIDPKLIEKNTINIQFNLNGNAITLSQEVLNKLPDALKIPILSAIPNEITEEQAAEIINS